MKYRGQTAQTPVTSQVQRPNGFYELCDTKDALSEVFRHVTFSIVTLLIAFCVYADATCAEAAEAKRTVGRVEKVWIKEAGIILDAKMDTGTLTSSLDAHDMRVFTKDGNVWVRFVIKSPDGKEVTIERLVVRFARFKKQGHDVERRPVIELGICVGDVFRSTQVNLSNRERFTYPVLIGRRFLMGILVVDTEKIYTAPLQCATMPR